MISIERYEARGGGGPSPITINKKSNKEIWKKKTLIDFWKRSFKMIVDFVVVVVYKKCL